MLSRSVIYNSKSIIDDSRIVIDNHSVMLRIVATLTDVSRGPIYVVIFL